ncbi:MAG: leucyl/phenylalanyl-tRNA--protein transferase [Woeseiaceae bacterium]|nr:leucyl/phenylalanyl-tRNA--protein transferase [Woeseiaceae bacterium]
MRSPNIAWISGDDPPDAFPDIESAFEIPNGLLAAGGDLSQERLLYAYRHAIFPWYDHGQPILWWSPDPRCILRPQEFHVSRRMRRWLRQSDYEVSFNAAFPEVISACAQRRVGQPGTWITGEMKQAFNKLHAGGWAHSIEVWQRGELVGGLYGLAIGRAFFGESMFSGKTGASKTAMLALCKQMLLHDFPLLDCQVESPHLMSLGATLVPRQRFAAELRVACHNAKPFAEWPAERIQACDLAP